MRACVFVFVCGGEMMGICMREISHIRVLGCVFMLYNDMHLFGAGL